jgi:hypothetical protein
MKPMDAFSCGLGSAAHRLQSPSNELHAQQSHQPLVKNDVQYQTIGSRIGMPLENILNQEKILRL